MTETRIHRADSADGAEIAGRVYGQAPPLVLVHGAPHDGDIAWEAMVPHLSDHFTCYLPSLRGRGLSEGNQDHSPPRLEEDVRAFVDSIGGPVFLVGWSAGVPWALGAAAHSGAVAAVAGYEPTTIPMMRGDDAARRVGCDVSPAVAHHCWLWASSARFDCRVAVPAAQVRRSFEGHALRRAVPEAGYVCRLECRQSE